MAWYKTGTVTVTLSDATVTGSGTDFVAGAKAGYGFLGPDGKIYEILSITSATALELATNYSGSTASAQAYAIIPTQGLVSTLTDSVNSLITDYQTIANEAGAGKFDDGTVSAPGVAFTGDTDTGLYRIGANDVGIATGGVKRLEVNSSGVVSTVGQLTVGGALGLDGAIVAQTKSAPFNIGTVGLSDGDLTDGLYRWAGVTPTGTLPSNGTSGTGYGVLLQISDGSQSVQLLWYGSTSTDSGFAKRRKAAGVWTAWVADITDKGGQTINGTLTPTGGVYLGGSGAANLLDDYEEGTWTVTLYDAASAGNASATTVTGYYTKTGDMVECTFYDLNNISTAGMTGGNTLYFTLPFTPSRSATGSMIADSLTYSGSQVSPNITASAARGTFTTSGSGVADSALTVAAISTGVTDIVRCSFSFKTAA